MRHSRTVSQLDLSHRKEGIQRIQIGLAGLTGVVLLIGLANIVVDSVKRDDAAPEITSASNASAPDVTEEKPSEPLVELGVTPASTPSTPVVADLQPDPNLKEPMDRPSSSTPAGPASQKPAQPQ